MYVGKRQIEEVIKRLNYYEKGLQAGEKIEHIICKLCELSHYRCDKCLAYSAEGRRFGRIACYSGRKARESITKGVRNCSYSKRTIRKWQTELKRRANANLKAAGSEWRIEWERVK